MQQGKFISFEGLDGAGKSTHIDASVALLRSYGKNVISTREPGGTPLAEKIRTMLLHETMDLATETLLVFAARQSHITELIRPALDRGEWVVCDRFTDATFAYQGGGRGVSTTKIEQLESWVHHDLQPDLTLLFDLPFEIAQERINKTRTLDRFEREKADFHQRVRCAYLKRMHNSASRIQLIDAAQSIENIHKKVEKYILTLCL